MATRKNQRHRIDKRRKEAEVRNEIYNNLTTGQKLETIVGLEAKKQRKKLNG